MNIYETRTMLQAIEQIPTCETFLLDTFASTFETFPTETFDIDFVKGKKKIAPFVVKRVNGVQMERNTFTTKNYEPPKIAPYRSLTLDNIDKRLAGETVYSTKKPADRAQVLLAKDLVELRDMIVRRKELMIAQALSTGKITINAYAEKGKYIEDEIDYGFTNIESLGASGTVKWNMENAATMKPLADLERARKAIARSTGKNPTMAIMGAKAAEYFLNSDEVKDVFDKRHYIMGQIEPSVKSTHVQFIGKLLRPALEIYVYDETYLDDVTGEELPFIPEECVIVGSRDMFDMKYGSVTQMEADEKFHTYEGVEVPRVWANVGDSVKNIGLTSKPIPVPFDIDSWYTINVNPV